MFHPESFLHAILENPRDDTPRLFFADWLDEHCDPRGEFIRVQCQLAKNLLSPEVTLELETRQRELLAEFEGEWIGPLAEMVDWWVFERGFVEEIGLSSQQFLTAGSEIFQLAPIREVHLIKVREDLEPLVQFPCLNRTDYLDLSSNPLRDQGARLLARSPHLARMRGLNLSHSGIGDAGLRALAASPFLQDLRELYLCGNRISDTGVLALANSPLAQNLDTLFLRFNAIGHDGAQLLQHCFGSRVHL